MTREKMNELVFAHDGNGYITSTAAAGVTDTLGQELPIRARNEVAGSANTNTPSPLRCPSLPLNLNNAGEDNPHSYSIPGSPVIKDDDTLSEWSLLGGIPLTPAISEGSSDWSLVSGVHTPAENAPTNVRLECHLSDVSAFDKLRCPLCPPNQKNFRTFVAFQAHMASAAHAPKLFHCPLAFMPDNLPTNLRKKKKYFSTLSGLAQHLESGACSGGLATFTKAIKYVEEQLQLLGLGGVKLLLD
jgi:hypothetical protein